jgi:hypothetical protein
MSSSDVAAAVRLVIIGGAPARHAALGAFKSELHRLWDVARVIDGRLIYDGGVIPLR